MKIQTDYGFDYETKERYDWTLEMNGKGEWFLSWEKFENFGRIEYRWTHPLINIDSISDPCDDKEAKAMEVVNQFIEELRKAA